jgi:primosomal protein N' (replication factor Y)
VPVLLPLPLAGAYDYAVPEGWGTPPPGTLVTAPLGGRTLPGVVWHGEPEGAVAEAKLRPLAALLPAPAMTAPLMRAPASRPVRRLPKMMKAASCRRCAKRKR